MRVVHRNIALYEAAGHACREVDAAAGLADARGSVFLAQWMRQSVLGLAVLVCAPTPDGPRVLAACERLEDDLRVAAGVLGSARPLLRALGHLDRVRALVEVRPLSPGVSPTGVVVG